MTEQSSIIRNNSFYKNGTRKLVSAYLSTVFFALACLLSPSYAAAAGWITPFTVPVGVTQLDIGAGGGIGADYGGSGGSVEAIVPVAAGDVITGNVAGNGSGTTGGYNGGGNGACGNGNCAGGGGGATWVYLNGATLLVAGGGGGGDSDDTLYGGSAGPIGVAGQGDEFNTGPYPGSGGKGATGSAGGAGGIAPGVATGQSGSYAHGGNGVSGSLPGLEGEAGGGGAGYYGGGGGASGETWTGSAIYRGTGGGGSNYVSGVVSSIKLNGATGASPSIYYSYYPKVVSFTASPVNVITGNSSTLSWTTVNATSCSIDHGIGSVPVNGSRSTGPLSVNTTFNITCTGPGGSVGPVSTSVTVNQPITFTASPPQTGAGGSSTLSWTTISMTSCSIDHGIGAVSLNGSQSTGPLSTDTMYTISCSGPGGSFSKSTTVSVVDATFTADATDLDQGASTYLHWTSTNTTSCTLTPTGVGVTVNEPAPGYNTGALTAPGNHAYSLQCWGSSGASVTKSLVITVHAPNISFFLPSSSSVSSGSSTNLNWSSSYTSSCKIVPSPGTTVTGLPVSGSHSTGSLTTTTQYTLTCDNGYGYSDSSGPITVNVVAGGSSGVDSGLRGYDGGIIKFAEDPACSSNILKIYAGGAPHCISLVATSSPDASHFLIKTPSGIQALAIYTPGPPPPPPSPNVFASGMNTNGQLGDGTNTNKNAPVQVSSLAAASDISGGGDFALARKTDGSVWSWGTNTYGELGNGTNANSNTPTQVSGLSGVVAVSAGNYHSLALKTDGTVWAWGLNSYGQLGDGTYTSSNIPVQVSGLSGVIAIAAGRSYGSSVALKSDGTVWVWGDNIYGEFGNGTDSSTTTRDVPVQVPGLSGIKAIAEGGGFILALKSDNTVWSWGVNYEGQLGIGSTSNSDIPVQIPGFTGVKDIAAGSMHALSLKTDGTVWAWGRNDAGQVGDSTTTYRHSPVQVSGLTGVVAIAAGIMHSLAIKSDTTVWAWGDNSYGELGNGNNTGSLVPIMVSGLIGVSKISGGGGTSYYLK